MNSLVQPNIHSVFLQKHQSTGKVNTIFYILYQKVPGYNVEYLRKYLLSNDLIQYFHTQNNKRNQYIFKEL